MIMHTCFHLFDPFSFPWILRCKPSLGLFLSCTPGMADAEVQACGFAFDRFQAHAWWGVLVATRETQLGFAPSWDMGDPEFSHQSLGFIADWIARLTIPGLSFEGNTRKGLMSVKYRISCLQMFPSKRMEKQTPTHSADSWMTFFQEITMQ